MHVHIMCDAKSVTPPTLSLRLCLGRQCGDHTSPLGEPNALNEVGADVLLRGGQHPPEVARLDVARRDAPAAMIWLGNGCFGPNVNCRHAAAMSARRRIADVMCSL